MAYNNKEVLELIYVFRRTEFQSNFIRSNVLPTNINHPAVQLIWNANVITDTRVTSHEHHGVSNHRDLNTLFNKLLRLITKNKEYIRAPHDGYFVRCVHSTWWRHQMETFSALLAICAGNSPFIGEFPAQRSVTRSFDVLFDLRLNKRLSKQSWGWWFETLPRPLWRHSNDLASSPNTFLWHVIFADASNLVILWCSSCWKLNNDPILMIRRPHLISNTRSDTTGKPSANIPLHENSLGELAKSHTWKTSISLNEGKQPPVM